MKRKENLPQKILDLLAKGEKLSLAQICLATKASEPTVRRALTELQSAGYKISVLGGRPRRFLISDDVLEPAVAPVTEEKGKEKAKKTEKAKEQDSALEDQVPPAIGSLSADLEKLISGLAAVAAKVKEVEGLAKQALSVKKVLGV